MCSSDLDRLVVDHLADKLFTTERCRALARDLVETSGTLRGKVDDRRRLLRAQVDQVEGRIAKWEAAYEGGGKDLDVVAPRLRELREQREKLTTVLADLKPLDEPPKHLLTDATIAKFQDTLRDIFISADTPMTKGYLRFLVDKIVVHDDRVEIQAKAMNALAFMARAPDLEPGDVNRPELVLAKGGNWLPGPTVSPTASGQRARSTCLTKNVHHIRCLVDVRVSAPVRVTRLGAPSGASANSHGPAG